MENSIGLTIDLSTEQGKAIFAAVAAVILGSTPAAAKAAAAPKQTALPLPAAPAVVAPAPPVPIVAAVPSIPTPPAAPGATVVPMVPPAPPVAAPAAPAPPKAPSAPKAPAAPKAPTAPKAPAAPAVAAPVVDFASLDEEAKREALKKLTTKHSKKGKTADMKTLYAAYGAQNVETVPVEYLDHFNYAINLYDTNGQDINAVLATFGS